MRRHSHRRLFAILLFSVISAYAGDSAIQAGYHGSSFWLKVSRNSDLKAVLSATCAAAKVQCEIDAVPPNAVVAPLTVSGDWQDVVSALLSGTEFNFVAVPSNGNIQGTLLVQARAQDSQGTRNNSVVTAAVAAAQPGAFPMTRQGDADEAAAATQPSSQPEIQSSDETPALPAQPLAEAQSESASPPEGMVPMPYADANGQPMYAAVGSSSARFLPYADASGNPITAPPISEERYLPYADANGNPIPAPPIEKQQYEPYLDASGNPIPIPR